MPEDSLHFVNDCSDAINLNSTPTTSTVAPCSGVARSLVLAGHLLYASSRESDNTIALA